MEFCRNGHPRNADNLYTNPKGARLCRPCSRTRSRAYYESKRDAILTSNRTKRAANRDQVNARDREYRAANRDQVISRKRALYAANRDKIQGQQRERYAADPEKPLALSRAWNRDHPEEVNAAHRRWKKAHPDAARVSNQNSAAKRRGAGGAGVSGLEWAAMFEAANGICAYCNKPWPTDTDEPDLEHIQCLSKGGKHELANVVFSCWNCNRGPGGKHQKTVEEWLSPAKAAAFRRRYAKLLARALALLARAAA